MPLRADLLFVQWRWFRGIGHVVHPAEAVHAAVDEQELIVSRQANVHRQGYLGGIADIRHRSGLKCAVVLLADEPELGGERGSSEGIIMARLQGPANLQGRTGDLEGLQRLAGVEVPPD